MEYIIFDLETTGLNKKFEDIIEFASVIVNEEGKECGPRCEMLIKPYKIFEERITEITNITWDMVKDQPEFHEVADIIAQQFKGRVPVAYYGTTFDFPFLVEQYKKAGMEFSYDHKPIDPKREVNTLLKQLHNKKLTTVTNYLGIPLIDAHRAMNDVLGLKFVFYKLNLNINLDSNEEFKNYLEEYREIMGSSLTNIDFDNIDFNLLEQALQLYSFKFHVKNIKENTVKEIILCKEPKQKNEVDLEHLKYIVDFRKNKNPENSMHINV